MLFKGSDARFFISIKSGQPVGLLTGVSVFKVQDWSGSITVASPIFPSPNSDMLPGISLPPSLSPRVICLLSPLLKPTSLRNSPKSVMERFKFLLKFFLKSTYVNGSRKKLTIMSLRERLSNQSLGNARNTLQKIRSCQRNMVKRIRIKLNYHFFPKKIAGWSVSCGFMQAKEGFQRHYDVKSHLPINPPRPTHWTILSAILVPSATRFEMSYSVLWTIWPK